MTSASQIDPNAVVPIPDYSADSLSLVISRIHHSSRFQHYILRADELDDLCRHLNGALKLAQLSAAGEAEVERLQQLITGVLEAQELVLEGSKPEAIARLRSLTP